MLDFVITRIYIGIVLLSFNPFIMLHLFRNVLRSVNNILIDNQQDLFCETCFKLKEFSCYDIERIKEESYIECNECNAGLLQDQYDIEREYQALTR